MFCEPGDSCGCLVARVATSGYGPVKTRCYDALVVSRRRAMAMIWQESAANTWEATPLKGRQFCLGPGGLADLSSAARNRPQLAAVQLLRGTTGGQPWILLAAGGSGVRVNGRSLELGIRVLRSRDEIFLIRPRRRFFFSTEGLPRVERFPHDLRAASCSRCHHLIHPGSLAVRCPNEECGVWHHQSADCPCWTEAEQCAICETSTELRAGFRWSPQDL